MDEMSNLSLLFESELVGDEATAILAADETIKRTIKLIFCTIYILLFIIGAIGNGYVIMMLLNIFALLSSKKTSAAQRMSAFGTVHMYIYILGLSVVDLLVISHLPLLVFEIIEGQWIFGGLLCKVYWMGESVNKLLSSFLMTVLSWDRFMAVCFTIKSIRFRNNTVALIVLFFCVTLSIILLHPVLLNSHSTLLDESEIITKCAFDVSDPALFMMYTFVVGFVIPAILISFFYLRVILRLRASANSVRKHSDSFTTSNSMTRLHKVTHRVVAIVLFYFICWAPYWFLNIALNFQILITQLPQLAINTLFFSAHILVCFNSAANPILYALINRELRQQHNQALMKRRRSVHLNAHRIQSDKPFILRDSPSDYFIPRRNQSFHQQRHSESSLDSNGRLFAAFAERCRASLPQTKLSKSLMGLRSMMTFGRTPTGSARGSLKQSEFSTYSQPTFSTALSQVPNDESSFIDGVESSINPSAEANVEPTPESNQIKILIQEYD
ncbi:G-PROTEIN-RECEP-F1-2 domain-containing protein [Aphelenchoides bicaudatus]|nr:G-PROTEIN-RECEP-F1-2 domain-containing protein [Aphelenchoides bicaudatus]